MSDVSSLLSLYNLLARASHVSCSKGASAFLSFLTTEDVSISFAINGFIPALQNQNLQIPQRILAAFVLHALYVSHDHSNPFHYHLFRVFESERAIALTTLRVKSSLVGPSQRTPESQNPIGLLGGNEQLVWVLWKILQGEADDLASYSPNILSRMIIPEHLRPLHLNVQSDSVHGNDTHPVPRPSSPDFPQPGLGFMGSPTFPTSTAFLQTRNSPALSGPSRTPSSPRNLSNRGASSSKFSPFDVPLPESSSVFRQNSSEAGVQVNRLLQQTVPQESSRSHSLYQHFPDPQGVRYGDTSSPTFSDPTRRKLQAGFNSALQISHNRHSKVIGDQTLLQGFQKPYSQSNPDPLLGDIAGIYDHPDMNNQTGSSTKMVNESSRMTPVLPRAPTESIARQGPVKNYPINPNITSENASSLSSAAFDARPKTRPWLDQISRPHSRTPSSQSAALYSPATIPAVEIFSVDGRVPRPDVKLSYHHELPQESLMQMNNNIQQALRIPLAHEKRTPTPTRVSPPTRSPGVIGSGRPSGSFFNNDSLLHHNTVPSRWSQFGIIGNGRPESSATVRDSSLVNRGTHARRDHEGMVPFSVLRMRSTKEESEKTVGGIISHPEAGLGDDNGKNNNGLMEKQTSLLEKFKTLSIEKRAQVSAQEADTAQALNGNSTLGQAEPVPIQEPSVTVQRQATPLDANATAFHPHPVGTPVSVAIQIKNEATTVLPWHSNSPLSSVPTVEHGEPYQISGTSQSSPFFDFRREEMTESHINEKRRDELSHAIFLLLSARERVLTLTEQRMLQPHLSTLTQPLSLLRPGDIPPLVAKNTDIAAKLLLLLLDRNDDDAERIERILKGSSENGLFDMSRGSSDDALSLPAATSFDSMAAVEVIQAMVRLVSTCEKPSDSVGSNEISPFGGREAKEGYLDAIRKLPPTMQSFNLIAKLLYPTHHRSTLSEQQGDSLEVRVANLVRTEVLGGFIGGCVRWIEHAEQEEKEGEVHDDRVAIAISSLCRFYSSLLKHGFVSAASEADSIEMMGFALQFSRFEEARSLYSTLAAART